MNQFTITNAQFTISGNKIIIDCGNVDPKTLFHSKIEVGTLNPGDTLTQNGEKFIVLDKKPNGEVFVIKADFLDDRHEFGENNDWRVSPIRTSMNGGEIYQHMCELFGAENIIDMHRDLTSLDGLDDYGTCIDKVSMLTAAEYAKYHKILGVMSEYECSWLTITPFSTPSNDYTGYVCYVHSRGFLCWNGCDWSRGVRPVLTLSSSTLVDTEE